MKCEEIDDFIGQKFGEQGQVEVIEWSGLRTKSRNKLYNVICSVCAADPTLFNSGIFQTTKGNLKQNKLPCGCSKSVSVWTEVQQKERVDRLCKIRNYIFIGFEGDWKGTDTKARLQCEAGHVWSTSVNGFLNNDNGCRKCALAANFIAHKKPDKELIENFMSTGRFLEGTYFWRSSSLNSRGEACYWKYTCPRCSVDEHVQAGSCSGVFESSCSNLRSGRLSCRCSAAGYRKVSGGYVYVLKVCGEASNFTGYGISSNIADRLRVHRRNLSKSGFSIAELEVFKTSGQIALDIENQIKYSFPCNPQEIEGFKREATYSHLYGNVVDFVKAKLKLFEEYQDNQNILCYSEDIDTAIVQRRNCLEELYHERETNTYTTQH